MKLIDHWFWSAFLENKQTYYKVMLAATLVNFCQSEVQFS